MPIFLEVTIGYLKEYSIYFQVFFFAVALIFSNFLLYKDDPYYFENMSKDFGNILLFVLSILFSVLVSLVWFLLFGIALFLLLVIPLVFVIKHICIYLETRYSL